MIRHSGSVFSGSWGSGAARADVARFVRILTPLWSLKMPKNPLAIISTTDRDGFLLGCMIRHAHGLLGAQDEGGARYTHTHTHCSRGDDGGVGRHNKALSTWLRAQGPNRALSLVFWRGESTTMGWALPLSCVPHAPLKAQSFHLEGFSNPRL